MQISKMDLRLNKKTAYIICGPTAVGKTDIAILLAKYLETAIISADSRQCYREMNIGTAKPSTEQLSEVKHYFINEYPVTTLLTAADFENLAINYLSQIFSNSNAAIVCGGTGLYIKSLCEGLDEMPETDKDITQKIEEDYKQFGLQWLQDCIKKEDSEFYTKGEILNPLRMIRALSFKRSTNRSILEYRTYTPKQRDFNIIKIGLELPRELLYSRINQRVDIMMQNGLLTEVEKLYPLRNLKNLQTVGYTELFNYLDGNCNLQEAIEKIKQNTRNYAKRQMTWFRKDTTITWINADKNAFKKIVKLINS